MPTTDIHACNTVIKVDLGVHILHKIITACLHSEISSNVVNLFGQYCSYYYQQSNDQQRKAVCEHAQLTCLFIVHSLQ